jgi:DNA repair protein RadA/Sms
MARRSTSFVCQSCGAVTAKWVGRCESCGEWNTIVEEQTGGGIGGGPSRASKSKGRVVPLVGLTGDTKEAPRIQTKVAELDRVTGGGFVRGAIGQVRLRAERLGLAEAPVALAAETSVEDILATLEADTAPAMLILDSVQTLWTDQADSPPGTVTQVRASAQAMVRYAKKNGTTLVLVGHVTKDGQIAGPRVVEHMVDAVLYFEGDGAHQYRILRSVKNRFGATDEIGVFEMTGKGLQEVPNPSALFLGDRNTTAPGAAVFAGLEGSRPLLIEIQALVAQSSLGTPRRAVIGWDTARLSMILAVLEARCGVRFSQHDVYLNVAGGLKINEPGADLAVAAALVSSLSGLALPANCVYFGEVSLSGAIRPVAQAQSRLKEAEKLGFDQAYCPEGNLKDGAASPFKATGLPELGDFIAKLTAETGAQGAT